MITAVSGYGNTPHSAAQPLRLRFDLPVAITQVSNEGSFGVAEGCIKSIATNAISLMSQIMILQEIQIESMYAKTTGANMPIHSITMTGERDLEREFEANARLIAEAPEMLKALKACLKSIEKPNLASSDTCLRDVDAMLLARDAIAKAEGRDK